MRQSLIRTGFPGSGHRSIRPRRSTKGRVRGKGSSQAAPAADVATGAFE